MSYIIESPFPSFNDTDGSPLNNGYVYVGSANLNPVTDPIPVYWDAALTQPAAQPIRTINGYLSRNGSPGRIYTSFITYSFRVTNNKGEQVFSDLNYTDPTSSAGSTYQQVITAIAGQTVFNLSRTYIPGTNNLFVYRNGLRLIVGQDYNETGYSQVTLTAGADNGDEFVFDIGYNYDSAASVDAQDVTYKLPAIDSVFTNVEAKLSETVSVKDFGAVGDGITDDTAAIQAAVNSLPPAGGALYFPTGTYLVSSQITVNKPGVYFGDGWATNIKTSSTTANTFFVTGAEQVNIQQMRFTSSVTKSGGWYVDVAASASRFRISDFAMDGAIGGIRTLAAATVTIERGQILNSVASTGIPVRIDAGLDVTVCDIICDQASNTFAGVYITNAGDITLEGLQLLNCGQALYVKVDSGNTVASLWANNCFFDNSTRGAYLQASGGAIVRSLFDQCWFSSSVYEGFRLETSGGGVISGVDIIACHVFLNGTNGVQIQDPGVSFVKIHDCSIAQNTLSGVSVAANVNYVSIQDSTIGATGGLNGNGSFGIGIAAGASNFVQILNNNLLGNTGAGLDNLATGSSVIVSNNLGANQSWTTYTPTVTAGSGAITTLGAVSGRYQKIGKQLFLSLSIPITTNGTGSVSVIIGLPSGMVAATACVLSGRESAITGSQLQGIILATSGAISVTKYDNSYPGGNGYVLILTGVIEVQ